MGRYIIFEEVAHNCSVCGEVGGGGREVEMTNVVSTAWLWPGWGFRPRQPASTLPLSLIWPILFGKISPTTCLVPGAPSREKTESVITASNGRILEVEVGGDIGNQTSTPPPPPTPPIPPPPPPSIWENNFSILSYSPLSPLLSSPVSSQYWESWRRSIQKEKCLSLILLGMLLWWWYREIDTADTR